MIGTFLAALSVTLGTVTQGHLAGMISVSHHCADAAGWSALTRDIPAGFIVAVLVWMLSSSKGFELIDNIIFALLAYA